ncbi:hypothetical protein FRC02_009154 [Tulasnella sp. 418]|nr:hypothetical protein FRC02_009154 [Tulasnella sp. 418]
MEQEDPSSLHREIKGLLQDYRKSLQNSTPWDRELEFQRNNIRRRMVHLIFTFPHSPQAQHVETPLWLDTSHALINLYRQRMSVLDKASSANPAGAARPHAVELRKLLNKFRSFLSAEESFWNGFVLKIVRTYGLEEAKPALLALNITSPDPVNPQADISQGAPHSSPSHPTPSSYKQPSEALTPEQRAKKLELVHKVLICLGDLARYREQYNENNGRPKAGKNFHNDDWVPKKNARGGRRGAPAAIAKARDYTRAAECYHQARLLLPDNGNPSNQLAVLAVWSSDSFSSVYHCYRALCVKKPFPTARENLEKPLKKALESSRQGEDVQQTPVEAFKESVILLHGLWHYKPSSSSIQKHAKKVISSWSSLISNRTLPSEIIVKTLILSLGALWCVRAFSPTLPLHNSAQNTRPTEKTKTSKDSEPLILMHILDLLRSLMEIGLVEVEEAHASENGAVPLENGDHHLALAQRITAAFRRTLPALRISFKWVKSNLEYINRITDGLGPNHAVTETFWTIFSKFAQSLSKVFPLNHLPRRDIILEEDADMRGFLPLKRSMETVTNTLENEKGSQPGVHPNEEQLMRIGDLLVDANLTLQSQALPVSLADVFPVDQNLPSADLSNPLGSHTVQVHSEDPAEDESDLASHRPAAGDLEDEDRGLSTPGTPSNRQEFTEGDDDNFTVSSKTEDDPVNLAMRATLDSENGDDEDDDEDMVVYRPKVPTVSRSATQAPLVVGSNHSTQIPTYPVIAAQTKPSAQTHEIPTTPPAKPVTAQDLLARAMLGGFSPSSNSSTPGITPSTSSNPQNHGSPSRIGGQRSSSLTRQATSTVQQPMLFGGSGSVWTPGPSVSPISPNSGPILPTTHPYAVPQQHIAHGFQPWPTRPQDMGVGLTGMNGQISRLDGASSPPGTSYQVLTAPLSPHLPAHGSFNPAVGSGLRPSGYGDPTPLTSYNDEIQSSQYPVQHQQYAFHGPFSSTPAHRAWG